MPIQRKTIYIKNGALFFLLLILLFSYGCITAPPEIVKLHQKELEIVTELQRTHTNLVDAYIWQKTLRFKTFFYREYEPDYKKNWKVGFQKWQGRPYNENEDSWIYTRDLIIEYEELKAPIDEAAQNLKKALSQEYTNAKLANEAVGRWIDSVRKLNESQRLAINSILSAIKPGLSLEAIIELDQTTEEVINNAKKKISLTN